MVGRPADWTKHFADDRGIDALGSPTYDDTHPSTMPGRGRRPPPGAPSALPPYSGNGARAASAPITPARPADGWRPTAHDHRPA
ncbi:hypothetical protein QF030_001343 [Streptomyces rishiriensis]|uniref:Uncharacterized protein n=1 Tax=Streptomyces rishiriensis TaxID=68264 RepID=A0ABU0NJA7_STRRH|nr:hypothetical protein [Streptomyces rishiriensis]